MKSHTTFHCTYALSRCLAVPLAAAFLAICGVAFGVQFVISDPTQFSQIIDTNTATLTTNATINTWLEGPVWIPSGGGFLLFCDQSNNKLKKLVLPNTISDFIDPVANTTYNGTTLDAQERLVAAQAGTAGLKVVLITNIVPNATPTTIVSTCNGLKFYSPNDVVVKSDYTVWFTDPAYNGVTYPQSGYAAGLYVYRCTMTNGNASCTAVVTSGITRPNGLCFSPDESLLYVADSDTGQHHIMVYNVSPSNTLSNGHVFANITNGYPDGIRCDSQGRVWSTGGDGAYIFATDGHQIGHIKFQLIANLCFGGPEYKTLFMVGQPNVVSMPVLVAGTPAIKKLQSNFDGTNFNLNWNAPSTGFVLQEDDSLDDTNGWMNVSLTPTVTNTQNTISIPATNTSAFYRLALP